MMYLRMVVVIFLAFICTPIYTASAQSSPRTSIDAQVGFADTYTAGQWTPVALSIVGDDRDRLVTVEWVVTTDTAVHVQWQQAVNLPARSRKLVTFNIIMTGFARNIVARIRDDADNTIIASTMVTARASEGTLHVVVSDDANTLAALANTVDAYANPREIQHITASQLPDTPIALRGVATIFLENPDQLTPAQASAVRIWASLGGVLVMAGDVAGALQDLALIQSTGGFLTTISLPESAPNPWPSDVAVPEVTQTNIQAAMVYPDIPLLWNASFGRGSIYHYSLNFTATQSWAGQLWFWSPVLEPRIPELNTPIGNAYNFFNDDALAFSLTIPSLNRPDPFGLFMIVLLYVLAIGPGAYVILERRQRLHQAWFVILGISAIVSIALIIYANVRRGDSALLYQLSIVEQHATEPQGYAYTSTALYTPFRLQYDITTPASDGVWSIDDEEQRITRTSDDLHHLELRSAIGSVRYVNSYQTVPAVPVISNLTAHDEQLSGSLQLAQTSLTLTDAGVFYQDQWYPISELSATSGIQITADTPSQTFPCDIPNTFTDTINRNRLYTFIFGSCGAVTMFPPHTAFLLGWGEPTVAVPTISGVRPQTQQQLYVISLDVALR